MKTGDGWCHKPIPIPFSVLVSREQIMITGVVGEHRCLTVGSYSEFTFQKASERGKKELCLAELSANFVQVRSLDLSECRQVNV